MSFQVARSCLGGFRRRKTTAEPSATANTATWCLLAATFGAVGASFAGVPSYKQVSLQNTTHSKANKNKVANTWTDKVSLEKLTSLKTTTNANPILVDVAPVGEGPVKVAFDKIEVLPGKPIISYFTIKSESSTPLVGVASYKVLPAHADQYFQKVQCFCFLEQRLGPGEQVDIPVVFYIDPEYTNDPYTSEVTNLSLMFRFEPEPLQSDKDAS